MPRATRAKRKSSDARREIASLEKELVRKHKRLAALKRRAPRQPISDYVLQTARGPVKLSSLFGNQRDLIVVHNMGQACRYCTMWADGFNNLYPHLANRAAFVVVSPDAPAKQRKFANDRGWKFPICSGEGSTFIEDMGFKDKEGWLPGVSTFVNDAGGKISRVASAPFGSFDPFCSVWHFFALLANGVGDWQPQYHY